MEHTIEDIIKESNDNADIIIEYLKMIVERLDVIVKTLNSRAGE